LAEGKTRIDLLMVHRGLAPSRHRAQALLMSGVVLVDGRPMEKSGALVDAGADIRLKSSDHPYVSRGGLKLKAAIDAYEIDVTGLVCLDVGASTGGFTDCLLQHGAAHVHAVDVGYGQLAWSLRQDPRVTVIERTNIRNMPDDALPAAVDLITIDTSFISLRIVVPAALRFLNPGGAVVALIKPQFEVGRGMVGKGGVVRDPDLHEAVLNTLTVFFQNLGLSIRPVVPSPVLGPKGNREFLACLDFA
jgi:23S rRNA (cytidine1920-2'-O)/16S rRNA (cytidine1409-2'-O)-methyltransferase